MLHAIAFTLFTVLSAVFFAPAVFEGKSIYQPDHIKAAGMGGTRADKYAAQAPEDEYCVWNDAMFSGLPYGPGYGHPVPSLPSFRILERTVSWIGWENASMTLLAMLTFYILLYVIGVRGPAALGGALCYAFSSYNIIVIVAGHIVKGYAIAYMPLVPAGMFLLFRRRWLWGALFFTLGVAFSIGTTHVQITYYLMLLSFFIYTGGAIDSLRSRIRSTKLIPVTGLLAVGVLLAVAPNALRMYTDWDMAKHSIRGPSELTTPADPAAPPAARPSSGLDKDYAFQWSYGRAELLNLLIPNAYGGESGGYLPTDSYLAKEMKRRGMAVSPQGIQTYTYWGDKPFTSGPAYMGAVVWFLFLMGMFLVRDRIKWWLLGGAVFLMLMSLGRNFDSFNTFLFYYLPLYNKFRTVEMSLVVPALVLPLIAFQGIGALLNDPFDEKRTMRALIWSVALTGGLCLVIWVAPEVFLNFRSPLDERQLADMPSWYVDALLSGRRALARADALRSLLFIVAAAAAVYLYLQSSRRARYGFWLAVAVSLLGIADLWNVNRRYLNDSHYTSRRAWEVYSPSVADKMILEDTTVIHYRVLGLDNPWQDTNVSFYHRSIGGYHAVKLRRYQELIDRYMGNEHLRLVHTLQSTQSLAAASATLADAPCLNMLNTRYVIYNPVQPPLLNPHAFGNAWFVDDIRVVPDADAELSVLGEIDPKHTAVVDQRFAHLLNDFAIAPDTAAEIVLTEYRPPFLAYRSRTSSEQLAVFSEIYYPGWKAFIDGQPADPFRVNWTLRALRIPSGEHVVSFRFDPDGYIAAAYAGTVSSFLILLLFAIAVFYSLFRLFKRPT